MKVQSVNNAINFGRVIEIKSVTNPELASDRMKLDNSTYKINDILNSSDVTGYSRGERKSVRRFFKDILEDYNGYNGILIRRFGKNRIALISGALMSIQGVFNTEVTKSSSIWAANIFVQGTALLVCLGAWMLTDRSSLGAVFRVEPKYMLLGGAIGAFITYTVIKSMDALGPARAVMLIVVAQLLVAYLIELFGLFGVEKQPLEWRKVIGMGLAVIGIILFKWK